MNKVIQPDFSDQAQPLSPKRAEELAKIGMAIIDDYAYEPVPDMTPEQYEDALRSQAARMPHVQHPFNEAHEYLHDMWVETQDRAKRIISTGNLGLGAIWNMRGYS